MRKFRITKLLAIMALCLVAAVMTFPPAAHAVATLWLDDGLLHTAQILDGGVGDQNPTAGVVTYIGTLGVWDINVSTGVSNSPGAGVGAILDLNSVDHSSAAGTLKITFSDTDFTTPGPNNYANMQIGGTTDGTVTYAAYYDNGNGLGALTSLINSPALGPLGPGAFSGANSGNITLSSPFSLTQVVEITHTGAGYTSFDAKLLVPLPSTAMLLGTCLLGLVGLGWRRRKT